MAVDASKSDCSLIKLTNQLIYSRRASKLWRSSKPRQTVFAIFAALHCQVQRVGHYFHTFNTFWYCFFFCFFQTSNSSIFWGTLCFLFLVSISYLDVLRKISGSPTSRLARIHWILTKSLYWMRHQWNLAEILQSFLSAFVRACSSNVADIRAKQKFLNLQYLRSTKYA